MKATRNRVVRVLHNRLNDGNLTPMLRRTILLLTATLLVIVLAGCAGIWIALAEEPCPGAVSPINRYANVRSIPSSANNAPIATLEHGHSLPAHEAVNGWHPLCGGRGYVAASVVQYATNTPIPASMSTPTPTMGATRIITTPTRIMIQMMYCREGSVTMTPVAKGRELVICEEAAP